MLCFCQIGILIHKTNLHQSIIYGTWWIRHDVKPPPPRMVWVISSSAPLWFLYIYVHSSIRWEKWWYLAPKESLLLIWLWIMQGFIWCQTMWQSSVLYMLYYTNYMVYDEQKLCTTYSTTTMLLGCSLKSPWTILFTTFRLAASFFDYNKVRG